MAADLTHYRYRADNPDVYAVAILALVEHARDSNDDFTFGPMSLTDCVRSGLDITGPDLAAIHVILSAISGLAPVDA